MPSIGRVLSLPVRQLAILGHIGPEKWLYANKILSRNGLCFPNFLGIGAQKAGTSWLYQNLSAHPELYLPEPKELHYFDWEFHKSLRTYAEKFSRGSNKVRGEITPGYSIISRRRIEFIRTIMPDVKLIFLMRNPIDRAWSQALMNLVSKRKRRFEEVNDAEFYAHFKAAGSVNRGDYLTTLQNWLTVFPSEQLLVDFFENITKCPKELLSRVFGYLGVSQDVRWDAFPLEEKVYRGPGVSMPQRFRDFLEARYYEDIEALYQRFGEPVAAWRVVRHQPQ